jgi:anti-sigma factor RsiW
VTTDECRRVRIELAAYASDRLAPTDAASVEGHLASCDACRDELGEIRATLRQLALADTRRIEQDAPAPPSDLVERILAETRVAAAPPARRVVPRLATVAAAAALVACVIGWAVLRDRDRDRAPESRAVALAVLEPGARATVALSEADNGTAVDFAAQGLDAGETYWLWLTNAEGERVGAGTAVADRRGRIAAETTCALPYAEVARVWVTQGRYDVVFDSDPDPA